MNHASDPPGLADVAAAHERLRGRVIRTPLRHSAWLSDLAGAPIWLKLESVQATGSFKIRGALNAAILHAERQAGMPSPLVTASAGNHGHALAAAARQVGAPLTVFVPHDAPATKTRAIERHGARLMREADYDAAERAAKAYAAREGATFISPYADGDVIAGAGTIALEIFEELPEARTVVVPVGGGGLASGIGLVVETQPAGTTMVGVETAASTAFTESLRAGRIVTIEPRPTLADGLAGNLDPESMTFPLMQRVCGRIVRVAEDQLRQAIVGLAREEHVIAEGAGAAATGALLAGAFDAGPAPVVVIVSGANIDLERFRTLLE